MALVLALASAPLHAQDSKLPVEVTKTAGVYRVSANFLVPESADVAFRVLTDYEHIAEFMPDIKRSRLVERTGSRAVVEQEAVARLLMFTKRVQLLLEIDETPELIRFRDRCGKSFEVYEGTWAMAPSPDGTMVRYDVTMKPAFDVPEVFLTRLLKRDATSRIGRLRAEMDRRSAAVGGPSVKP